jgi:regulator of sigma E protease
LLDKITAVPGYILPFIVVLGVLVFFHELGHYLAARWRGVHVEAFSIGFGRALVTWTDRHGTDWKLAWIPLGGYVKLHGQERPEDVSADVRALWQPGRTFHEKDVLSRAIVVAAGPVANFVLAAVLYAFLFASAGRPVVTPVVGEVISGSAAEHAGLMKGDRILDIDGRRIELFEDVQKAVAAHPGQPMQMVVARDGAEQALQATPESHDVNGRSVGILGIRGGAVEYHRLSLAQAVPAGVAQTWDVAVQTVDGLWQMITLRGNAEDLGGPLRIAQLSGEVAKLGVASLVSFIALLSVNLGLINLFPIPILDGGHLLFYLFEAIRGRPLPPQVQEYGTRAGLAILVALFLFATRNDLAANGLFRWIAGLLG